MSPWWRCYAAGMVGWASLASAFVVVSPLANSPLRAELPVLKRSSTTLTRVQGAGDTPDATNTAGPGGSALVRSPKRWLQRIIPSLTDVTDEKKKLDIEFLTIAAPSFIQFTAEPLAGLVDTMYLGRLGRTALAGVGIAISAQYSVSKLYNDPLLRTSISLVASSGEGGTEEERQLALSRSISTALLLALTVGLIQGLVYTLGAGGIIRAMGVSPASEMYAPAVAYLRIRALGTPAATLWLVSNGIFRGLGDTLTPLKWSLMFTALNAILDPICMFNLGMGAAGAALGTAVAQYVALIPMLVKVSQTARVRIDLHELIPSLRQYLSAATLVFARTWAKILAYAYCARQAALLGVVAAAAYNLTFQVGFATTQLCESIAIAVQTLIARELSQGLARPKSEADRTRSNLWHLIKRGCYAGAWISGGLSVFTLLTKSSVLRGLTSDQAVRTACEAVFPLVMLCQVNKGLAYPVNGIIMGGLDWSFSTAVMFLANAFCMISLLLFRPVSLNTLWGSLALFMAVQWISGVIRFMSGRGVWQLLKAQPGREK